MSKDEIKDWLERQRAVLNSINEDGSNFHDIIDSDETYDEWLRYELSYLLKVIKDYLEVVDLHVD